MKCASCGKEFGNGANCQYCGVDRITGLGNYSGYSPAKNIPQSATYTESHGNTYQEPSPAEDKNIICYNCGEVIPKDAKFCPYCSTNLYVTCPKCGKEYSSQFPACSECGTNRDDYYRKQREDEERERLYKKWVEIFKNDPTGKAYEKIKDDNNISWLERHVAEQVIKELEKRKIYEKWQKIFREYPDASAKYQDLQTDMNTSPEEKRIAGYIKKFIEDERLKQEKIEKKEYQNRLKKEAGKIYSQIEKKVSLSYSIGAVICIIIALFLPFVAFLFPNKQTEENVFCVCLIVSVVIILCGAILFNRPGATKIINKRINKYLVNNPNKEVCEFLKLYI